MSQSQSQPGYKKLKAVTNYIAKAASKRSGSASKFRIKSDSRPEQKFVDIAVNATFGNLNFASIQLMNGTTVGTTNVANRIGGKIQMKSVYYNLAVMNTVANLGTVTSFPQGSDNIRVALVYDKQTNGAAPGTQDIWEEIAASALDSSFAPRNVNNYERFSVLADEKIMLNNVAGTGARCSGYIKVSLPTRYGTSTGTVTDIASGGLFLIVYDSNISAGLTLSTIVGYTRVLYEDV